MKLQLNPDDAYKVLSTPEIFQTISEDGMTDVPMPEGVLYLCGYVPELIGCFILHKQGAITLECHVQVLPEYRKDYAEQFGHAVIDWAWENTGAQKIVAQVPFLYPNVRDFALKMGFKVEGMNRESYLKNGEIYDQWYLGIIK